MNKRLLLACLALAVHHVPHQARAQFTDAHSYDNTPVGINQLELSYAYVRSDTSIDTSLVITGAKLNLNQGTIGYTRYFGVWHRLMWGGGKCSGWRPGWLDLRHSRPGFHHWGGRLQLPGGHVAEGRSGT